MDPRGSVAIVTGATRGMGRAISERLTAEGARVVLVARTVMWVLTTPDSVHVPDIAIHNYRNPFEGKGSSFES